MLKTLTRKSFLTLYLSVLRPYFVMADANLTTSAVCGGGSVDADKYSVAYVTVPNNEVAKSLAHGLVKKQLAACVNIIPQITSVYMWKGEVNEDTELLLMIKTRTSQVDQLTTYVRSNHPYEVCEVISLPIKNGNPPYLKWIGETVPETDPKRINGALKWTSDAEDRWQDNCDKMNELAYIIRSNVYWTD